MARGMALPNKFSFYNAIWHINRPAVRGHECQRFRPPCDTERAYCGAQHAIRTANSSAAIHWGPLVSGATFHLFFFPLIRQRRDQHVLHKKILRRPTRYSSGGSSNASHRKHLHQHFECTGKQVASVCSMFSSKQNSRTSLCV